MLSSLRNLFLSLLTVITLVSIAEARETQITFIHLGDIHGHLIPRPHLRSDGNGMMQGGLARMYTKISEIRKRHKNTLLVNTGDTIQGSAEGLFTQGQALVDVLNAFEIDYFAAGNWDFVYGTKRFIELFAGKNAIAPWGGLAANLYYDGEPYADKKSERVLPPYVITEIDGVKVGILGFTSERGPKVVGTSVVDGFYFSNGEKEMAEFVPMLRSKVDLLVVISELGLAGNIHLASENPGVDLILSSDMHEETPGAVVLKNGTLVVEEGQDGTRVGEMTITMQDGRIKDYDFTMHVIDESIKPDSNIAKLVEQVRMPFVKGKQFKTHKNPINGKTLNMPIDTVVGQAKQPLYRGNFAHEFMPAVIEGSSHDFLTDAFKTVAGADIGLIRGFRYGTHIAPGPIKLEDIYHYMPVGPFIAKGELQGKQIRNVIEMSADGSLNPEPLKWKGGWLFAWSGLRIDLDPRSEKGQRVKRMQWFNAEKQVWEEFDENRTYTVASYNYDEEPDRVNKIPAKNVQQVLDKDGSAMDGVQVVVEYLKNHDADPELNRFRILGPLPGPLYTNYEMQPLHGVPH